MWLFDDATSVLHGVDDVSRNPDATELGSNVDKCTQSTPTEYVGLRASCLLFCMCGTKSTHNSWII